MTSHAVGTIPQWTIADRLRKAREHTGLDQADFADRVGVTRNTIGNAERGRTTPSRLLLKAWALCAGVPLQWLETGKAPDEPGPGEEAPRPGLEPGTLCEPGRVIPLFPTPGVEDVAA